MAIHGKNTRVLYDGYDLSEYFNAAETSDDIEPAETTTFSGTRRRKTYVTGFEDANITLNGLFSGDADSADQVLHAAIANPDAQSAILISRTGIAIGGHAEFCIAREMQYNVSSPIGDVVTTSLNAQSTSGLDSGVVLAAGAPLSATGDLQSVDQTSGSASGGAAHLHVIANDHDGAADVILQHSTDGSVWVDLINFTSVPAEGTDVQRVELPADATVHRYLRARAELGGTTGEIRFVVAFARHY